MTTRHLWALLDDEFLKQRNINFEHYVFLTRKQLKGEPIEKFHVCLREPSLSCDRGSHEKFLIRDVFIAKMIDEEKNVSCLEKQSHIKGH